MQIFIHSYSLFWLSLSIYFYSIIHILFVINRLFQSLTFHFSVLKFHCQPALAIQLFSKWPIHCVSISNGQCGQLNHYSSKDWLASMFPANGWPFNHSANLSVSHLGRPKSLFSDYSWLVTLNAGLGWPICLIYFYVYFLNAFRYLSVISNVHFWLFILNISRVPPLDAFISGVRSDFYSFWVFDCWATLTSGR